MKSLTIAIPCYKRPDLLEVCVRSIFRAIGDTAVSILIVDDSGDVSNNATFARLLEGNRDIKIIKNESNIGIDRNICRCIEMAVTDYVWLIGEDDLMYSCAISNICRSGLLDRGLPFIFVNYSYVSSDYRYIFRDKAINYSGISEVQFIDFFGMDLWAAGFIGGCIIGRKDFISTDYNKFIGTYYAHVGGICLSAKDRVIGVHGEPLIYNRVGSARAFTWSNDSYGVFQGWRLLLKKLATSFSSELIQAAWKSHKKAHGYLSVKFVVAKKADGLLQSKHLVEIINADTSLTEKITAAIGFFVPTKIASFARGSYASIRRTGLKVRLDE